MSDETTRTAPEPPPLPLAMVQWVMIPPLLAYIAMGQALPVAWERLALDTLGVLFFGFALSQLKSFPALQQPIWAPLVLLGSAILPHGPTGWQTLPFFVGVMALVVVPGWLVGSRVRVPWWVAPILVPPMVVLLHVSHQHGEDLMAGDDVVEGLVHDLTWPARAETIPPAQDVGPPLIVISVDTLRADSAMEMETWKRLSERGAWWPSAMATSSWTLPSLASIQTGMMPGEHGAGCLLDSHCQGLADGVVTLATELSDAGYRTAAVSANPWAGRTNGIDQGFDIFKDLGNDRPRRFLFAGTSFSGVHHQDGGVAVDLALAQLDRIEGGSFYLWLHVIDPHLPYMNADDEAMLSLTVQGLRDAGVLSDDFRNRVRAAYAHEVDLLDAHLVRFLDALESRGLMDEAVVVFTSDHGEEFWEHGGIEHGHTHHREVIEVPLVVSGPGVDPGRRDTTASILDIATTLRHAAGLPEVDGVDLRARSGVPAGRIAGAEGNLHHWLSCSARNRTTRVIIDGCASEDDHRIYGFDLVEDPGEYHRLDLPARHAVRQAAQAVEVPAKHEASSQNTAALEALGYVDN